MSLGLFEAWEQWQPNNHVKNEFIILPTSRNYSTKLTADNHFRLQHCFGWPVSRKVRWGLAFLKMSLSDPCSVISPHLTSIPKTWPTQKTCGQLLKQWLNTYSTATSLPLEITKSFQRHFHLQTIPLFSPPSFSMQRESQMFQCKYNCYRSGVKRPKDNTKWEPEIYWRPKHEAKPEQFCPKILCCTQLLFPPKLSPLIYPAETCPGLSQAALQE